MQMHTETYSTQCVRGELETEQNCNILTPTLLAIAAFLFRLPGLLNWGPGSHSSIFSPTDLNFLSPELYNNLMPTYFLRASQFALNSTLRQSRLSPDPLIPSTGCTCYLHRCISHLTARLGQRSICYTRSDERFLKLVPLILGAIDIRLHYNLVPDERFLIDKSKIFKVGD